MKKSVGRLITQSFVVGLSATLIGSGVVAIRHALETPQVLKSTLPGESFLYGWKNGNIFYKVYGEPDAPPLVLLHTPAIGASAYEMRSLIELLARTYRVYAPDMPGFGLSDRPRADYSSKLYTAMCHDFIHDVIQQPTTLVASGLSCNYAVSLAAQEPELCAALVLLSPIALHGIQRRLPLVRQLAEMPLAKTFLYPILCTHLAFFLSRGEQSSNQADFAQFYAVTHQIGAEHATMALLAGNLSTDTSEEFEALQQPVLIIWGTQALNDRHNIASLHDATQKRHAREVELIQGAGLLVHLEQPERVAAAILRWQPVPGLSTPSRENELPESNSRTASKNQLIEHPLPMIEPDAEPEAPSVESTIPNSTVEAYCVRCKKKTEVLNAHEITMKNGRPAVRGSCAICGTGINRIGSLNPFQATS